jgi:hypothetical protein
VIFIHYLEDIQSSKGYFPLYKSAPVDILDGHKYIDLVRYIDYLSPTTL